MAFNPAGTVLEQVGSMVYGEISSAWGVKDDLKKLQQIVAVVKPVLEVAEEKQADNPELSIWVTQLKDIFLDAQDVLEEFECQVLRTEVVYKYGSTSKKIGRYFSHSNPLSRFRFSISHKVKDIKRRLDEIWSDKKNFPSINQDDQYQNQTKATNGKKRRAAATRAYLVAGVVFGREDDKRNILDYFLFPSRISDGPDHPSSSRISDLYGHQKLSVIAIQGVEGIGKTTLAKLVYNDDGVTSHFQHKIWVSVSAREDEEEDFDVPRIIRDVIKRVTNEDLDDSLSLDQLASRLQKSLKDQMFLLVLDDVSSLNHEKWSALLGLLETAAPDGRSRIIVTTRKLSIASIVRTVPTTYKLKGLSQENSWHLFLKLASTEGDHDRNRDQLPQHLEEIGREIVEKCEGIPLALKVLGSVFSKLNEREWKFIRDNEMWKLDFWIENQVLNHQEGRDSSRNNISFYQDIDKFGLLYSFYMHDLVNDLARISVSQSESVAIVDYPTKIISERVQHLSFTTTSLEDPICLKKANKLRSILFPIPGIGPPTTFLEKISELHYLRVLDLSDSSFEVLPNYVGEQMKLLRYLNLSRNVKIKILPNSICKLQSLETLELAGCTLLEGLPRDMESLVSLIFLSITTTKASFSETRIGSLGISLRTLIITNCNALKSLAEEVMGLLTRLETLMIIDCEKLGEDENDKGNNIIPLSLRTLVLMKLPQLAALPRWLQGSSSTLNYLRIEDCNNLRTLPQWLTRIESLQKLTIRNCEALSFLQEDVLTYLRQNYTNEFSRLQIKIHGSPQLMRLIQGREEEHSTEYQGDTRAEEEQGTDHGAEIQSVDA